MNDSAYIFKAYIRRAEARRKRGKRWEALQDVDAALALDPTSTLAIDLRRQIETEYKEVEGDLAKETRPAVVKKSRMQIEEVEEEVVPAPLQPFSITEMTEEEALAMEAELAPKKPVVVPEEPTIDTQATQLIDPAVPIEASSSFENKIIIQDVDDDDEDFDDIDFGTQESQKVQILDHEAALLSLAESQQSMCEEIVEEPIKYITVEEPAKVATIEPPLQESKLFNVRSNPISSNYE